MAETRGKLAYLDSIRGIAAFVVVVDHLVYAFCPILKSSYSNLAARSDLIRWFGATPLSVVHNGTFSVRLFFVLSGFVLSLSFFRTQDQGVVASAAIRRYFRLVVPALVSVLLAWALIRAGLYRNLAAAQLMSQPADSWLNQWGQFDGGFLSAFRQGVFDTFFCYDPDRTLNSNLWSMSIELRGSFLVFSILALVGMLRNRWVVYLALFFILDRIGGEYYCDFVGGLALCDILFGPDSRVGPLEASSARGLLVWLGVLAGGIFLGATSAEWLESEFGLRGHLVRFWPTVGALMIILAATRGGWIRRILEFRMFRFLGKVSFSLYLVHFPLTCTLAAGSYVCMRDCGMSHFSSAAVASALTIGASLITAWLLYHLTEAPAISLGRIVEHRFFRRWNVLPGS